MRAVELLQRLRLGHMRSCRPSGYDELRPLSFRCVHVVVLQDLVPFTANNTFYTTGDVQIKCGLRTLSLAVSFTTFQCLSCRVRLFRQEYMQLGYDVGSRRLPAASTDQIINWYAHLEVAVADLLHCTLQGQISVWPLTCS